MNCRNFTQYVPKTKQTKNENPIIFRACDKSFPLCASRGNITPSRLRNNL